MTNHKSLKIFALIAVAAFIIVFAMTHFRPVESTEPFDVQSSVVQTQSDIETTWMDNDAKIVFDQTTKYYDNSGAARLVMNTKIECDSVTNGNVVNMDCKCTAEHNNQVVKHVIQNSTTFTNTEITKEAVEKSAKQGANECIKYGASQFFGMD